MLTPSQTVGPFFGFALPWPGGERVVADGFPGAFWVRGRVRDGDGEPVPDALVETWQVDPDGGLGGALDGAGFRGFGRSATDETGAWHIYTVKPGLVPAPDGRAQAPHLAVSVFARGLLDRLVTRVYFADEERANANDPVLATVPAPRRATLLARQDEDGYTFDIRLQGEHETVFFVV